jgi:uncharacterized membrane protein
MELLSLLATHRILKDDTASSSSHSRPFFPYEYPIAALAIAFFRMTMVCHNNEPAAVRWLFSALLALLAFSGKSYELILAVELFSYVIVFWLLYILPSQNKYSATQRLAMIAGGAILCLVVSHALTTGLMLRAVGMITPSFVVTIFKYLFPIDELREAIDVMFKLSLEPETLAAMFQHLLFVTAHIQIGIGFLGIHFLTKQQSRRNLLVRLDVDENGQAAAAAGANSGRSSSSSNGDAAPTSNEKPSKMVDRARSFKKGAAAFSTCLT